jgi:PAS domain-containing protein
LKARHFTVNILFARRAAASRGTNRRKKVKTTKMRRQAKASKSSSGPLPVAKQELLHKFAHTLELVPVMLRKFDGEILLWGRGIERLYCWHADEAVGHIADEFLSTEFPLPLPDIQTRLRENGVWQGELARTDRNGRRLVVASQWALYQHDCDDSDSVLEFDWDISEARCTQVMLEEREVRLRSVLETAPDPIITIDEGGIIQSFSSAAEKLFGYPPGEVIGHNVKLLMPPPHREKHDDYIASCDRGKAHYWHWPSS